jgi:hypothetical protein
MVGFGHKQAWLAVRGASVTAVRDALGLRDLGPVAWREGVDLAYLTDNRAILTPPLTGTGGAAWILVAGRWLLTSDVDIAGLSKALETEVQSFSTYRVGEVHSWARAIDGVAVRTFAYAGQTVTRWQGDPDPAEGLPDRLDDPDDLLVAETDVFRVAGAWSVDPTALSGRPAPGPLQAAAAPAPQ